MEGAGIPLLEICVRCWKWDCPGCGPGRRVEAFKVVKSGIEAALKSHPKIVAARFATFTYPNSRDLQLENPEDLRTGHGDLRRVIQQLRRTHGRDIEYVAVTEPTKRGRIHFHVVFTGPHFIRKCTDPGRRRHSLPTGEGSGSPCYCSAEKPCIQRIAWHQGMGWVKIEVVRKAAKAASYLAKYLAKGADDTRWPRYARRMSRSTNWGSLTFAALRRQWIEEVRALKRAQGEEADLPAGDLVWELVPAGTTPFGVHRETGEVLLPSRLR